MELEMEEKGVGGFFKRTSVIMYSPRAINPCSHITRYGTGLSLKFICLGAGSLALYKGL
jgi:hypothetical protein